MEQFVDTSKAVQMKVDTENRLSIVAGDNPKYAVEISVNAKYAVKFYGGRVTIRDTVYGGKVIKDSGRTYLYLGGKYPNQVLTVSIDSKAIKKSVNKLIGYQIEVSGKLLGNKSQPYIFIRDENVKLLTDSKLIILENLIPE